VAGELRALERRHEALASSSASREELASALHRAEGLTAELHAAEERCDASDQLSVRLQKHMYARLLLHAYVFIW
jgi:hypothetical protein